MARVKLKHSPILVTLVVSLLLEASSEEHQQLTGQVWAPKHRSLAITSADARRQTIVPGGTLDEQQEASLARQADSFGTSSTAAALSSAGGTGPDSGLPRPPPSRCLGECTKFGTCNEELGRCDCPLGRNGTDCSQQLPEAGRLQLCARYGHTNLTCGAEVEMPMCLNACNFRGRCLGGFCHCRPGLFGADCSLSLAVGAAAREAPPAAGAAVEILAGQGYALRPSGPRIYVYELPPQYNIHSNLERLDRPLMYMLWQRWLSAGLRVADPTIADFFFVPVRVRLAYDSERVMEVLSYIRATWPYWNATGGTRHVFVHTGDWGREELSEDVQLLTRNATWLTHWGLARDHTFAGWKAAHRPGLDIVLPPMLPASVISHYRMARVSPLHPAGPRPARDRTMFFAGRVCGSRAQPSTNGTYPNCPDVLGKEDAYSAATRQRAFFYHHNRTNWKVVTGTRSYAHDMVTTKFCLAPTGAGQGKRSVLAALMGCVPVTVTDGVLQPFEPEMRWEGFAVDVRERDIGVMHELLERLAPDQLGSFQANLRCAAQHLFWSSLYGSVFGEDGSYDAFETLVQVLRMRAVYPTLAPEEYAYVDPAFAAFLNCRSPPPQEAAVTAGAAASSRGNSSGNSGGWPGGGDLAKPGLAKSLSSGSRPAPQLRALAAAEAVAAGRPPRQALCSHSQLPTGAGVSTCNRCVRRRGRLLNPGGTLCCNTRELAKCPRLWD